MAWLDDIQSGLACGRQGCDCHRRHGESVYTHCPAHEDGHTSLSATEKGGKPLVKCHAGCSQAAVVDALKAKNLWPHMENEQKNQAPTRRRATVTKQVIETYDYRDESGALLFQVQRTRPKGFPQRRPDPSAPGGFTYNLDGVRRVLFRLPELIASADSGKTVWIVEGEKDVHTLTDHGLVATTSPGGAGKWRDEYATPLRGRNVVILPDNDPPDPKTGRRPGQAHAADVARCLHGVARSVRILSLPDLPDKGDVTDWFDRGGTVKELIALAKNTPPYEPPAEEVDLGSFARTDLGNARRLIAIHGADLRYVHSWLKWVVWDGCRWAGDDTGEVQRRVRDVVRLMHEEADAEPGEDRAKQMREWARKCESLARLKATAETAADEPGVALTVEQMDQHPMRLTCANGTVDLTTGCLHPHDRQNYITKLCPVAYDLDATCLTWEKFLYRILDGNEDTIRFLQRAVGFALTGDTRRRHLVILYGKGRNGKSTFLDTVHAMLGDYALSTSADVLMVKQPGQTATHDLARLRGARFVSASETEEGARLAAGLVKQVTGNDVITARLLYQNSFEFKPEFKLFLATNHQPKVPAADDGLWDRLRFVPFTVRIPDDEVDETLPAKLLDELPGILAWAVRGCMAFLKDGLGFPSAVEEATAAYREEMDAIGRFLSECAVPMPHAKTPAGTLYKAYSNWCEEQGEYCQKQTAFGRSLGDRGYPAERVGGKVFRVGIGVIQDS